MNWIKYFKSKFLFQVFLGLLFVQSIIFLFSLRLLRPIADDYCAAALAGKGFAAYFNHGYFTWNSDVVALIINYFILGFPLVHFPYALASIFTLATSLLALTLTISVLLFQQIGFKVLIKLFPITVASYFSFWMSDNLFHKESLFKRLSNMIINWQSVNGYYVVLTCLLAAITLYLIMLELKIKYKWTLITLLGFLLGTSGFLLVATILSFNLIYIVRLLFSKQITILLQLFFFSIGLSFGFIFDYLSPGSQTRSKLFEGPHTEQILNLKTLLSWTFPRSLIEWVQGFLQPGALVVVLFGIIIGYFSNYFVRSLQTNVLIEHFFVFLLLSIISSILSQLSEKFAYEAFWHLVIPYLFIYLSLLILGFILGINSQFSNSFSYLILLLALVAFIISSINLHKISNDIKTRSQLWQVGAAPLPEMGDIEIKDGWINICWEEMKEFKGYPDRNN